MLDYFDGNVLLGSIILTLVILIFSEITPKTIASVHPEIFATKSSWLLKGLVLIFRPLAWLLNIISSRIMKFFNVDPMESASNDNLNSDELRTLLDEHGELISTQSREMLSSILGMEELTVEDIMTPHAEIKGINLSDSIEDAQKIIATINGLYPNPGAWFLFQGERYKILKATLSDLKGQPGSVLDGNLTIACGDKSIKIQEIQPKNLELLFALKVTLKFCFSSKSAYKMFIKKFRTESDHKMVMQNSALKSDSKRVIKYLH
jgi:hypothetical protein